ncbi:molecular chaperone SurA [bacterium]|nr:molecular chaperone SurA [bacterium]
MLDRMILDNLQIQRANRMGIRLSDQELHDALANIARNNSISLSALRDSVESEGTSFRHFREQLRKEIAIKQLQRRSVIRNIVVTDKEVDNFLRSKKGQQMLTPELFVEHLLLPVSSKADGNAQQQAEAKITSLRQSAGRGKSFSQLAQENTASEVVTNDFGWRRTSDMPGIFVEVAASLNKGDISEPIRSDSGFHLIRVKDTRGGVQQSIVETKARHILIKPNAIRSAADSKALIDDIGRQLANGADFAALAKQHSDDPGSALLGGNLDWTKPGQLVPEFQAMMEKTDIQAISPSFETEYGWHILQVLDKRTVDASNDIAKGRARIAIGESKYDDELNRWLQKLRDDAFVEIK